MHFDCCQVWLYCSAIHQAEAEIKLNQRLWGVTLRMQLWDQAVRLELSLVLNPTGCVPFSDLMQLHYTESCRLQAGDKYLFADVPMLCVACSSVVDLLRMTLTAFSRRVLPQADLGSGLLFGSDWRRLLLLHSPAEPLYHKYLTVSFASGLLCTSSPTPPCLSFSYCKSV